MCQATNQTRRIGRRIVTDLSAVSGLLSQSHPATSLTSVQLWPRSAMRAIFLDLARPVVRRRRAVRKARTRIQRKTLRSRHLCAGSAKATARLQKMILTVYRVFCRSVKVIGDRTLVPCLTGKLTTMIRLLFLSARYTVNAAPFGQPPFKLTRYHWDADDSFIATARRQRSALASLSPSGLSVRYLAKICGQRLFYATTNALVLFHLSTWHRPNSIATSAICSFTCMVSANVRVDSKVEQGALLKCCFLCRTTCSPTLLEVYTSYQPSKRVVSSSPSHA